jgi:CRP-like cAMP-binding protein
MSASGSVPSPPFLHRLAPEARELLLAAARPVSFVSGATLVRHGDAARGAFILREGSAEARIPAPGGEHYVVARLSGGDIFGEMALVEAGTCTATVVATAHVDGWFLAFEDFRGVVSQRHPASRELQHAVTLVLAERLRAVNAKQAAIASDEDRPARPVPAQPPGGIGRPRRASFDLGAFLPRLAFFERFPAEEIDEVAATAGIVEAARGAMLYAPGGDSEAVFVVARGAVEVVRLIEGRERRVAVLGPGKLLGFMGVLLGEPHGAYAWARENTTLLEIPSADFRNLYFGEGPCASRLRGAVQRSLLESLARTNRSLTRLAAHARLSARGREAVQFEAANAAQLWMARPRHGAA